MTVARRVSRPIGTKTVPYPMATTSEPTAGPAPMSQAPVAKPATNQASPTPTTATARGATRQSAGQQDPVGRVVIQSGQPFRSPVAGRGHQNHQGRYRCEQDESDDPLSRYQAAPGDAEDGELGVHRPSTRYRETL